MGGSHSRNKHHEKLIDFEGAEPGAASERKVFDANNEILQQGSDVLQKIADYKGCQDLARVAMSDATYENEKAAFEGLLWAVDAIAHFHEFSMALEKVIQQLLNQLCTSVPANGDKEVSQPAMYKQMAQVFDFALQFDNTRMNRPNLSNDFSYYRRLLPKFNKHPNVRVKDDEASGMALFTAEHIPMTKCLAKGGQAAYEKQHNALAAVSILANSCLAMIKSGRYEGKPDIKMLCARAMTGATVLYDHISESGAFHKRSAIPAGSVIKALQEHYPNEHALTNAIRFSSKNFKTAPNSVQNLFS